MRLHDYTMYRVSVEYGSGCVCVGLLRVLLRFYSLFIFRLVNRENYFSSNNFSSDLSCRKHETGPSSNNNKGSKVMKATKATCRRPRRKRKINRTTGAREGTDLRTGGRIGSGSHFLSDLVEVSDSEGPMTCLPTPRSQINGILANQVSSIQLRFLLQLKLRYLTLAKPP